MQSFNVLNFRYGLINIALFTVKWQTVCFSWLVPSRHNGPQIWKSARRPIKAECQLLSGNNAPFACNASVPPLVLKCPELDKIDKQQSQNIFERLDETEKVKEHLGGGSKYDVLRLCIKTNCLELIRCRIVLAYRYRYIECSGLSEMRLKVVRERIHPKEKLLERLSAVSFERSNGIAHRQHSERHAKQQQRHPSLQCFWSQSKAWTWMR